MSDEEWQLHHELLVLIQKCMPSDKKSPFASFLPGFTSLRLLLIQQTRTAREDELLKSILSSYASYKRGGLRSEIDMAVSSARDFMMMSKQGLSNETLESQSMSASRAQRQMQERPITTTNIPYSSGFNSSNTNNLFHGTGTVQNNHNRYTKIDGDSLQDALILNTFSMSGNGQEYPATSFGVSPALHSISDSPALCSQINFSSLGNTPTLQPIPTPQDGQVSALATVGTSSSPIDDMLHNDSSSHFQ